MAAGSKKQSLKFFDQHLRLQIWSTGVEWGYKKIGNINCDRDFRVVSGKEKEGVRTTVR